MRSAVGSPFKDKRRPKGGGHPGLSYPLSTPPCPPHHATHSLSLALLLTWRERDSPSSCPALLSPAAEEIL